MNVRLSRLIVVAIVSSSAPASAETLAEYVTACKADLGISGDIPAMNCNDGVRFAYNPQVQSALNDYVGYKRINNYVDLAFACRWLAPKADHGPFTTAASLEMLIHNRQNGQTCFFAARSNGTVLGLSTSIVSPTNFGPTHPNADDYWLSPAELNSLAPNPTDPRSTLKCVACHDAGPYIASPRIAPFLSQYGLLNNGHDTVSGTRRYQAVNSNHIWSVFFGWNNIVTAFLAADPTSCSAGCHDIALNSNAAGISGPGGQSLIPAIYNDIADVVSANLMPSGSRKLYDDYRWNNVDIPDDINSTGDAELFYDLKANWVGFTPTLNAALTCETEPAYMEAHVVGSTYTVRSDQATAATTGFPDVLEKFDQTGLICRNASQSGGMCSNYVVRYACLKDKLSIYNRWTGRAVTVANPDAYGVRYAKGQPYNASWGPLSQVWHVEGLNDGSINYSYVRLQNPWSTLYLNVDYSLTVTARPKTDSWLSEQWVMENINGTKYVRFRNLWQTNLYLTMVDSSDYSAVNAQPLQPDWWSQQWELK